MKSSQAHLRALLLSALIALLALAGCTKSYVDPKFNDLDFSQLAVPAQPVPVLLEFEFQTLGNPNSGATSSIRPWLVNVLRGSRAVLPVEKPESGVPTGSLRITMNNVGDMGSAVAKGFGTGLTFGLVGSMVTDGYEFTADYTPPGSDSTIHKSYEHAIHTTVGNKAGPPGLTPMSTMEAFHAILEDLVIIYLKDLQGEGHFVNVEIPTTLFPRLYSSLEWRTAL